MSRSLLIASSAVDAYSPQMRVTCAEFDGVDEDWALGRGEVRVYYRITSAIDEAATQELIESLPVSERDRCIRHRFPRDRRDFAAAHALLRGTLSRYENIAPGEWRFDVNECGKPSIAREHGSDLSFNLSHTHGLVACAVARGGAIGIDVEAIERIGSRRELAAHYFSPVEIDWLDAAPESEYSRHFIEVWTLKEAYIKAVGLGLSHPLNTFSFVVGNNGGIHFTPPPEAAGHEWAFTLFQPAAGYRLAIAVESSSEFSMPA